MGHGSSKLLRFLPFETYGGRGVGAALRLRHSAGAHKHGPLLETWSLTLLRLGYLAARPF